MKDGGLMALDAETMSLFPAENSAQKLIQPVLTLVLIFAVEQGEGNNETWVGNSFCEVLPL